MSFSARDAILNDEEEWFNIPTVVRSFLRQLNNEVQNNHLTCDNLKQNQQEHDKLLKGLSSKQTERELEMTKTVLALRQECHEVESSICGMVDSIREQMRHLSEEQHQTGERIRQIEVRERETIALRDSLRAQSNSLCKTLNYRSAELETLLRNGVDGLSKNVGELEKDVRVLSEKQDQMLLENQSAIERFNMLLQQVCNAVSEEVDGLREQINEQRQALEELKSVDRDEMGKYEKKMKTFARVCETVDNAMRLIKQLETSSDKRFESVFSAMEKSQALTNRLSVIHQQRGEDHSSLMSVLQETRDMHSALAEELRSNLVEQSNTMQRDLERLNRRVSDIFRSKDDVLFQVNEKINSLATKSSVEKIFCRLDTLEATLPNVTMRAEMEGLLNDAMLNQRTVHETSYMDVHRALTQQKSMLQSELNYLKTTVDSLNVKYEQIINSLRKADEAGETFQTVEGRLRGFERNIEAMRGDIDTVTDIVKSFPSRTSTRIDLPSEDVAHHVSSKPKEKDEPTVILPVSTENKEKENVAPAATSAILDEVKLLTDQIQQKLGEHDAQFKEVQRNMLRHDTLVREIPRSYQRYMDTVDQKLSPILVELDFFRERVASLEPGRLPAQPCERIVEGQSHTTNDENSLEKMRLNVQKNEVLYSAQRQLQAVDVRLDGVQALVQSLERRIQTFSRELSDVSESASSAREQEQQKELLVRSELKRVFTELHDLEDEVKASSRGAVSREQSLQTFVSNLRSLQESIDTALDDIKVLERSMRYCITATSPEWKELSEGLSALSRDIRRDGAQRLHEEHEKFAPLFRVTAMEEVLAGVRRELHELALNVEHIKESMVGKIHLQSAIRDGVAADLQQLSALEQRVGHLEEVLREDQSWMRANRRDMLASLESRLQSLEVTVGDVHVRQLSMASPSSSSSETVMSGAMQRMTALEDRLDKLEGVVSLSRSEDEKDAAFRVVNPAVLSRLSAMEGALVACSSGIAQSNESVSLFQKRLGQMEESLSACVGGVRANNTSQVVADACIDSNLADIVGRLERLESSNLELQQDALAQKDAVHAGYNKSQVDSRFETMWASFIALLTRKEDQETVNQKLAELQRSVTENLLVQMNTIVRELQRAIEERVSVTEVRELLRGVRE